jgi:hypothetical protein
MMKEMKSQLKWLKEKLNFDSIDYIKTMAKFRGYQSGTKYAEAFKYQEIFPTGCTSRKLP